MTLLQQLESYPTSYIAQGNEVGESGAPMCVMSEEIYQKAVAVLKELEK